ncbi:hypothetical protein CTEN210_04108 [Chaetoceros tenuissimus]|uniref:Uncharacterized protein n=1 Tax=Chaetoceros tenuissimus TaxID=426638 RepID=A0AAD3CKL0_9STRA|nr:hypothetical protein CTEN210_04108 [Chaetoceros tenuissimus]
MSNTRLKVSHTSDRGVEVPSASISDLPNDLLKHCFSFIPGSYVIVAPVSRQFHKNYCTQGMDDSLTALSTDSILKIGRNRRTTVNAASNDVKLTEYCFINKAPEDFMIKVCRKAAMKGHIDVIECANAFGVDFIQFVRRELRSFSNLMTTLAEEGNLEIIQYIDSKLPNGFEIKYSSSDDPLWQHIFSKAAASNHLHIMKWIYEEKIQNADSRTDMKSGIEAHEYVLEGIIAPRVTEELCTEAAKYGNIEVLEYCHRNNFRFDTVTWLWSHSMENKDKKQALVTLKWLRQHGCPWNKSLCSYAALNDNLEALKWARSEGCPWDARTLCQAAKRGDIPMIEYCLQNQCPMIASVCTDAMFNKDHESALAILKLLRKFSCPWNEGTINIAGCNGNFEAMFWAKHNGCPWTTQAFAFLVQGDNVSIIEQFLKDELLLHGSILFVQTEGTVKMTPEVVREINSRIFSPSLLPGTGSSESLIIEKLKLLRKYGYEWNVDTSTEAVKHHRFLVLRWLKFMGCPMDADTCTAAVKSCNIEILKYAHEVAGCALSKEAYAYCFNDTGLKQRRRHRRSIPTTVRDSHRELLKYLEKNDCPKPDKSDWTVY